MPSTTENTLRQRITAACAPVHLEIEDESHLHKGHVGVRALGGGHFNLLVVSRRFEGQPLVQRHRMIYEAVGDLLPQEVHALSMRTLAPSEWSERDTP